MKDEELNKLIIKHLSPYFENKTIPSYLFEPIRAAIKERTTDLQKELDLWDSHKCQQNNL